MITNLVRRALCIAAVVCGAAAHADQLTNTPGAEFPNSNQGQQNHSRNFGTTVGAVNSQSGTAYTLALSDCGKLVYFSSGSAITLTLPNSLPIGCTVVVEQGGAGQITVSAGSGASFNNRSSYTKTAAQYGVIGLTVDTNATGVGAHWVFTGDGA